MKLDDLAQAATDELRTAAGRGLDGGSAFVKVARLKRRRVRTRIAVIGLAVCVAAAVVLTRTVEQSRSQIRFVDKPPSTSQTTVSATATTSPTPTSHDIPGPSVETFPPILPSTSFFTLADTGAPTFITPAWGWVLASDTATPNDSPLVLRTTDGGRTWARVGAIPIGGKYLDLNAPLHFANPSDGWMVGDGLYSTHDGGETWNRVSFGRDPPYYLAFAATAANGQVEVAVLEPSNSFRIYASPVDHDNFVPSPLTIPYGLGASDQIGVLIQLAVGHNAGLAIRQHDQPTNGPPGARLDNGQWTAWTPPCWNEGGTVSIAANPSTDELVYACTSAPSPSVNTSIRVYVSHDAGRSFTETAQPLPAPAGATTTSIALAATGHIIVSWDKDGSSTLEASNNDGQSWSQRAASTDGILPSTKCCGNGDYRDLQFTTANDGVGRVNDTVAVTHDGGQHWTTVLS